MFWQRSGVRYIVSLDPSCGIASVLICQCFRALDPSFLYFHMDTDCPSSDPMYYGGASAWAYEAYDASIGISTAPFGSDPVILSDFDPSFETAWPTQDVEQGSSPSSVQSSLGRAPSSNTSYNEYDNVDPVSAEIVFPQLKSNTISFRRLRHLEAPYSISGHSHPRPYFRDLLSEGRTMPCMIWAGL